MSMALDTWLEVWEVVRRNRLRTLLTMGGVFWGMFMLLLMAGFGKGLERGVANSLGGRSSNAVFVWAQRTSLAYRGMSPGREVDFKNADLPAIRNEVSGIEVLVPRMQLGGFRTRNEIIGNGKTGAFQVMGDAPELKRIQPMSIRSGRFINPLDMEQERKVAVVGAQVAKEFWGEIDPVGDSIQCNGVWFRVVGVFDSRQSGDTGERAENTIHIPFATFQRAFNIGDSVGWIALTGQPDASAVALEKEVRQLLAKRHRIHPEDEPAIGSYNAEEEWRQLQATFAGIRLFVVIVGSFTLLSGVVGVSNILLVTVRERTSELGLRRALGATQGQVVRMILREAMVLVGVAGYAGLVIAVAFLELSRWLIGADNPTLGNPQVELELVLISGICLVFAGALAAWVPARRAAAISPVEALRAE